MKEQEPSNKEAVKKVITKAWKDLNADKSLLTSIMSSIPRTLQTVIDNNGDQIKPHDC